MNIFHYLAGADKDILKECSRSEKIKIAGYGILILIPAIIGLISMTYAISTLTPNKFFYCLVGVIWFFIVLVIDRFIISTMYKSKLDAKNNFWVASIARFSFAIIIGLAVAHPMTLLWFNDSITEKIELDKNDSLAAIEKEYRDQETVLDTSSPEGIELKRLKDKLTKLEEGSDCLKSLLTAERGGTKVTLACGYSSGHRGYRGRAQEIEKQIEAKKSEINKIETRISNQIGIINTKKERQDKNKNTRLTDIETFTKRDYLKRIEALDKLKSGEYGNHIATVSLFIILFFVFLDILPFSLKLATPYGEYEAKRDTQILKILNSEEAKKEVLETIGKDQDIKILSSKLIYEGTITDLENLTRSSKKFIKSQEEERSKIDNKIEKISKNIHSIKDPELKKDFSKYIIGLRTIFTETISKAQDKYLKFFKEL